MVTKVQCPTCLTEVEWVSINTFRPFCSQRCQQIDLGAWAEEKYAIPAVNLPDDADEQIQGSELH